MSSASQKSLPKLIGLAVQIREIELQIVQRKRIVVAAENRNYASKATREKTRLTVFEAILETLRSLQPGNPARSEGK